MIYHSTSPNDDGVECICFGLQKANLDYTFTHWGEDKFALMPNHRVLRYEYIGPTSLVEWKDE